MAQQNFQKLAQEAAQQQGTQALLPVIEKEILHYEILLAMDKARLLEQLVFQGGTCLRLCYGSERYSEDLDFVGGVDFGPEDMQSLREILIEALSRRYAVDVEVVEPRQNARGVFSWQVKVVTAAERPDLPQQRISVEVAAVPAHTRTVRPLSVNYSNLPSSYGNVLVTCETLEEICADKLKAFITASYIRYRDIWDMRWLSVQPGFRTEDLADLLVAKLNDYQAFGEFRDNISRLEELCGIVEDNAFVDQMKRFLPAEVLEETLDRPIFQKHLAESVQDLYKTAKAFELS